MRLDSLIILRIEWNSYVSYLRGKQWKYWRIKLYTLCCVVCCVVLCLVRPSVVVVLRPSSVPSVRRRRPSSSSVRPSVPSVRRRRPVVKLRIQGRMQIFEKTSKYESYSLGTRGDRMELDLEIFLAGWKLLCVLKKLVLQPKHFCFRILVPMSILTFWIYYIYNDDKIMIIMIKYW